MSDLLLLTILVLLLAAVVLLALVYRRVAAGEVSRARLEAIERGQERTDRLLRDEFARSRDGADGTASRLREEVTNSMNRVSDSVLKQMVAFGQSQASQFETFSKQLATLTQTTERKLEQARAVVDERLKLLQEDNGRKLEQMRTTVDEKLQGTLEKRLGESFKQVSDRLQQVYTGLGEMKNLATGVGDLKRVLTNVKTRGGWGEIQLENLLGQILAPDQYEKNVAMKETGGERVEFAIRLPGQNGESDAPVWLPIDAKFPDEDYQRLYDAQELADPEAVEQAARQLERTIKGAAKDIAEKYLNPPRSTDFGIMFLPTEGLYAEVLRRPGLVSAVQHEHRVVVAGPTTLAALLNSLQMGFRTLAIQKRSSEVWTVLGAVKTEFGKFEGVLEKVQKKLQEASNTIDQTGVRTRAINRKLRNVQEVPPSDVPALLGAPDRPGEEGPLAEAGAADGDGR